jgi:hypothetical protein
MSSGAKSGFGTTLTVGGSAVTEIVEIGPPGLERTVIDTTFMASDNSAKEYIMGLLEGGEVSVRINFVKTLASTLFGYFSESTFKAHVLTLPSSLGAFSYNAWIKSFKVANVVIDDKVSYDLVFKVTGTVAFA